MLHKIISSNRLKVPLINCHFHENNLSSKQYWRSIVYNIVRAGIFLTIFVNLIYEDVQRKCEDGNFDDLYCKVRECDDISNECGWVGYGSPQCGVLVCGSCMVRVWFVYDSCMVHVWFVYGSCMVRV